MSIILQVKVVEEPSAEPLTLSELYAHLRLEALIDVDSDGNGTRPDDDLLLGLLTAAREYCEEFTGRSIAVKTYAISLDSFPDPFELPRPPFVNVVDFTYDGTESDSILVESQNFYIDTFSDMATVQPIGSWPTIREGNRAQLTYRAGYGVPGDASDPPPLPGWARAAMLLIVEHLYANRGATADANLKELPMGVEFLLRPHRVRTGLA
jgi:uncharacterized phiE125 gp8 family phage protein